MAVVSFIGFDANQSEALWLCVSFVGPFSGDRDRSTPVPAPIDLDRLFDGGLYFSIGKAIWCLALNSDVVLGGAS